MGQLNKEATASSHTKALISTVSIQNCRPVGSFHSGGARDHRGSATYLVRTREYPLTIRSLSRALLTAPLAIIAIGGLGWSVLAIWFDGPSSRLLGGTLAGVLLVGSLLLVLMLRPLRRGLLVTIALAVGVGLWWNTIPASNNRDWMPDVARTAQANFDGSRLTIQNIRNFTYRSEANFDQNWETQSFDLAKVKRLDLFLSFWGPTMIAHTIVSWEFADGRHLAISIETRKEKGETYSALLGFFRHYELYYVAAEERDVVGLRAKYRGEQVYLYHLRLPPVTRTADRLSKHRK
jgi:hypothetical protein